MQENSRDIYRSPLDAENFTAPAISGVSLSQEEAVIARGDVPVARLVRIVEQPPVRRSGTLRGTVKVPGSFFQPLPDEDLDAWEAEKS